MGRRSRRSSAPAAPKVGPVAPPAEQASAFELAPIMDKGPGGVAVMLGKAYRRRPMIDVLRDQGLFSDGEYKALRHYRHHADIADRSPLKDSIAGLMRISYGRGSGPTVELLNAIRVRDDIERASGSLVDILRAVVVDDMSLSQWAMNNHGSVEKCRDRKNGRVCVMEPRAGWLRIAQLEIKMAAGRVEAELAA